MVPLTVTGRNDVSSREKEHAKEKVAKLERYFSGTTRIEIVLDKASEGARAELIIHVAKGAPIVVHHDDKELYAAIDLVIDKAETQLTRHKEKLQDRRSVHGQEDVLAGHESGALDEDLDDDFEDDDA